MTDPLSEMHTGIAHLQRIRPDLLEVRYHPGAMLNTENLTEVQEARRALMGSTPYGMISIIPGDVDYALSAMYEDHLEKDRKEGNLLAIAVVTHANMMEMVLKLYFSHFPQLGRIKVSSDESEAREWLEQQMEELGRTGS